MTDVVTGEAVALELPAATFPSRIAALLLDMLVQFTMLLIILTVLAMAAGSVSSDYAAAAVLAVFVLVLVGYPTAWETLTRGKTIGKMALGIRVVGDDGSPVRFRQALVRALIGVFEIWTVVLAPVGLITSIISTRGKRVGDIFAGTYVIQERVPPRQTMPYAFAVVPPPLAGWAEVLQVSRLSDQTADAAGSYLRRFGELSPQARDALGIQLANAVAAQVSPPPPAGTPPTAYLSAVLAVRRYREQAKLAALQPTLPPPPPPDAALPAPPPDAASLETAGSDTPLAQAGPPQTAPSPSAPPQTARPQTAPPQTVPPAAPPGLVPPA